MLVLTKVVFALTKTSVIKQYGALPEYFCSFCFLFFCVLFGSGVQLKESKTKCPGMIK